MKHDATLRKVGGSVMLAIPPALLNALELSDGTHVSLATKGGTIVLRPAKRPRYSLEHLLAETRTSGKITNDRKWIGGKARGRELI